MTTAQVENFKGTFELFQNPEFAQIIARHHRLSLLNLDGLIMLIAESRWLGYTNGTIGSPEVFGNFEQWEPKLEKIDFAYLKIHTTQKVEDWERFCISPTDNFNMLIDLSLGEEKIYDACTKKCRESIRIGARKGVTLRATNSAEDLQMFYAILQRISGYGRKFEIPGLSLLQDLMNSSYGKLLVAMHEERIIGGYFLLLSKNVHVWVGGIDKDFTHLTPGNVMMFETIKWAIAHGYELLDMCDQSLSENEVVAKFKMSFSPVLKPAYVYYVPKSRAKIWLMGLKNIFKLKFA